MDFFNQNNYERDLGYVNYPQTLYASEPTNYASTNNVTFYATNLRSSNLYPGNFGGYENTESRATLPTQNQLDEAIVMIRDSVMDEVNDEMFYNALINQAIEQEDKDIIASIRDDEMKHNKLLRDVYYSLTGVTLPQAKSTQTLEPMSYLENLKRALMGEIEAAAKYRKIMSAMPDKRNYANLMEIMVDEIRHSSKYNYLITKNLHTSRIVDKNEPND